MRKIIGKRVLLDKVPVSETTIWRMELQGLFPKRITLSQNRVGWFEDEIQTWQESRPRGPAELSANFKAVSEGKLS